jgi:hypothetical protein
MRFPILIGAICTVPRQESHRSGFAAVRQRERGISARRLSRNVWKLSRSSEDSEKASTTSFGEGFRRRL